MARSVESSPAQQPHGADQQGWRHFGDGNAGRLVAARIQGWNAGSLGYVDVAVDVNGNLLAALSASSVEIGTVDQGSPGVSAWKVDGSAVTQPVSAGSLPLPTGAAKDSTLTDGTQRVGGTLAVTGSFWQATQPVSGTFFQATQPVSGTFWQATQPVSGPATDAQLRASAIPVSGSFFQATQPVSGTVDVGATNGLALDTTLAANVGKASDAGGPAAYTVLDQLQKIRKSVEQQAKTSQALLDAARPASKPKPGPTLLHRR